jgi:hypothetical protein
MRGLGSPNYRPIGIGLVLVFLTLFGLAAPASAADQVSFTADFTVEVTSSTRVPGGLTQFNQVISGNATHLGDFTGTSIRLQDNKGNFVVTGCLVGANGEDSVCFALSSQFAGPKGSCVATATGTYTVTGGTGSFANATGGGTFNAELDRCAGTITATWVGTISRPNSR